MIPWVGGLLLGTTTYLPVLGNIQKMELAALGVASKSRDIQISDSALYLDFNKLGVQ